MLCLQPPLQAARPSLKTAAHLQSLRSPPPLGPITATSSNGSLRKAVRECVCLKRPREYISGRDRDGGPACVVPPDRPCFHLGLSLLPEVLSTLDYWCCRFSMIKLVDITYSEHQIFAYHYLHRNLLSAHMPATSAAGAGKKEF